MPASDQPSGPLLIAMIKHLIYKQRIFENRHFDRFKPIFYSTKCAFTLDDYLKTMQNQPHTNTCSEITGACYFNIPCVRVFPARFEMDFKETAFPSNTYGRKTALSDNA